MHRFIGYIVYTVPSMPPATTLPGIALGLLSTFVKIQGQPVLKANPCWQILGFGLLTIFMC